MLSSDLSLVLMPKEGRVDLPTNCNQVGLELSEENLVGSFIFS